MGGAGRSSSKFKKSFEEDRSKRKNPKSRKRRRVSFSPSSCSSDTDDVARHRRSSRRKAEKRRGRDPKRSTKRKNRKARHRSVSSASRDSSSSCSTCRSRSSGSVSRSRSPVRGRDDRKGKLKKKVTRARKLDKVGRSFRRKNSSLSCTICSGSTRPSQTHSYSEAENAERACSRQIGSSSVIESQGEVERYGSRCREIDNKMVMTNYDDLQLPRANVELDMNRVEEDRVMDEGSYEQGSEIDRWMSESNVVNDSYFDHFEDSRTQASGLSKEMELNKKLSSRINSEIVAANKQDSDSDDLEMMLRQKALENLKKLRGGLLSDNRTADDGKNELARVESFEKQRETVKKIFSSPKSSPIVYKESEIQLGVPSLDSNVNPIMQLTSPVANHPTSDKKTLFSRLNRNFKQLESSVSGQSTSNPPNDMEDSPEKMSLRQSPCKSSLEKNATEGCGSGDSLRCEENSGDGKEKIREDNETVDECQGVSQYEEKTFSRMHDGEMVQVSYKVYIPKKAPALARRKLLR